MTSLVIGYGSIGQRHARLLESFGERTAVVSRRSSVHDRCYADMAEALRAEQPDYAIVADETSRHGETLRRLAASGFTGRVLVEKPLLAAPATLSAHRFAALRVAYNLRFHPVLRALRMALTGTRVLAVHAYVGRHLSLWRPDRDYGETYSAKPDHGGGVLRDLSHELDFLLWIFGGCQRVAALGGRLSTLRIGSDDCWAILMATERCPAVTLQLNYLDRPGRRDIVAVTDDGALRADLVANTLDRNGAVERFDVERDDSYIAMHRAMLDGREAELCSEAAGTAVVGLIDAIERAGRDAAWVVP